MTGKERYELVKKALQKIFNKQKALEKRLLEMQEELAETQQILADHILEKNN